MPKPPRSDQMAMVEGSGTAAVAMTICPEASMGAGVLFQWMLGFSPQFALQ